MRSGTDGRSRPSRRVLSFLKFVAAPFALLILGYLVLWYFPDLLARHDVAGLAASQRAAQFPVELDDARGGLLTLATGVAAFAALIFTARTFALSRQGQLTDRYTRAIEQLGSEKIDVRIGGIYALERIARDSAPDHPTVMEVLAAFIREHSHEPRGSTRPLDGHAGSAPGPRPDIQAALTVIGRRDATRDQQPVDLDGADLSRAQLSGADLAECSLNDSNLTGAYLFRANLRRAELAGANLVRANLDEADLSDADLTRADLTGTLLTGTGLRQAVFSGAKLAGTALRDVDLTDAQAGPAGLGDIPIPEGWESDPVTWRLRRSPGAG